MPIRDAWLSYHQEVVRETPEDIVSLEDSTQLAFYAGVRVALALIFRDNEHPNDLSHELDRFQRNIEQKLIRDALFERE